MNAAASAASAESVVDLRSDTVTRPTPGMREAMAGAVVGDDVFDDDPTLHALQERVEMKILSCSSASRWQRAR